MKEEKGKEKKEERKSRQIIIETDGKNIKVVKSEVASEIEFIAILQAIIARLNQ